MYIPFNELSNEARIWIYQSDKVIPVEMQTEINDLTRAFLEEWTAHQQTLHASFTVLHNYFLILAVDENVNLASGCSIDKSVKFIEQLGKRLQIDFFNRMNVVYKQNDTVQLTSSKGFIETYQHNDTMPTFIFNNLILTKKALAEHWLIPAEDSWLGSRLKIKS
jgi:hypothetical protein